MQVAVPGGGAAATGDERLPERHEALARDGPRIYVASLSDYNAGILHGAWIDASEADTIEGSITEMLAASPTARRFGEIAEEWAIHDFEGFGSWRLGEHEDLDVVAAVAGGIIEHGLAFAGWAAHVGADAEALERFEDVFLGEWESVEAFAESMIEDLGLEHLLNEQVPEALRAYVEIDVAGFARDLELGGDVFTAERPEGGVWVFQGW